MSAIFGLVSNNPVIIQGGMGVGISDWKLARAVSRTGALGVVSGTALDQVLARRLQDGDPGGHMRHALAAFPFTEITSRIFHEFYIPGGKGKRESYKRLPMHTKENARLLQALCIAANFCEVYLAREGHSNPVGINYLEKVQIPHLPSLYGAMLAGVGYVLMGAGIPLKIPGAITALAAHQPATYPLTIAGAREGDDCTLTFDPGDFLESPLPPLAKPKFLAIIAANVLATTLLKRANGPVDGFIVEGPTAGGHNAPPRGKLELSETGEPIYGERDAVDLGKMRELGVPFWLAGGCATREKLDEALAAGAAGIQAGTAFAFCEESGLRPDYKGALLAEAAAGRARVFTDPYASPTGFPFKVAQLPQTASNEEIYQARPRVCDLGYLREAYRAEDGSVGYRCPGEPATLWKSKGGKPEEAEKRKCLCNALLANIGMPQIRAAKHIEPGLVTAGEDISGLARFLGPGKASYSAADVIASLVGAGAEAPVAD
jgi:nitronate monooxygenase